MEQTQPSSDVRVDIEQLRGGQHLGQVIYGVGVIAGMAVLWGLECARNAYFKLLDGLNVKARRRKRASAFPPGRPRRRRTA
jgi:hypothetical protein